MIFYYFYIIGIVWFWHDLYTIRSNFSICQNLYIWWNLLKNLYTLNTIEHKASFWGEIFEISYLSNFQFNCDSFELLILSHSSLIWIHIFKYLLLNLVSLTQLSVSQRIPQGWFSLKNCMMISLWILKLLVD